MHSVYPLMETFEAARQLLSDAASISQSGERKTKYRIQAVQFPEKAESPNAFELEADRVGCEWTPATARAGTDTPVAA
jgi:hypothetical protein